MLAFLWLKTVPLLHLLWDVVAVSLPVGRVGVCTP